MFEEKKLKEHESVASLVSSDAGNTSNSTSDQDFGSSGNNNLGLGTDKPKPNKVGTNEKFFKR